MNDEKLIELVRQNPSLYDLSNSKYMNTEFKNTIWSKIGEEMKTTGNSCKSRWANIRDNFRKSLNKNKIVSGQQAKIVKPYKYSEPLSFLKKFFEDRETMSNIDAEVMSQDLTPDDESVSPGNEKNTQHDSTECNNPVTVESQSGTLSSSKQTGSIAYPTPRKKTKQSVPNAYPPKTAAATVMEYLIKKNVSSSPSTSQHPVDAFLAGIAPALKKLPPRYWHYAKADIFVAVQKYELKILMDQEQLTDQYPVPCSIPIYFQQPSTTKSNDHYTSTKSTPPVAPPLPPQHNHQATSENEDNSKLTADQNQQTSLKQYFQNYSE